MSNENELNIKEEKIENIEKSINKDIQQKQINNSDIYSPCSELKMTLTSNIKSFKLPLNINKSSLNFIKNTESKLKKVIIPITNTSIFIGGGQNLKAMRIHLSNNFKYNNTVHREISNFKKIQNKSVDKTNVRLTENKSIETVNIDLFKNEKDELLAALKTINLRWKNNQTQYKNSLSYISNNQDAIILNKKKYLNELISKINITSNNNNNKLNQENYILIKQDKYNKNNNFIYEIINPNSNEELEVYINNFIYKNSNNNNNKENLINNSNETTSDQDYLNNGKKKSKFSNKKIVHIKNKNSEKENNIQMQKEDFVPIIILSQNDIKELYEIIEKNRNIKQKSINTNYSIDKNIFFNYLKEDKTNLLRGKKDKNMQKNLDDINFNIFPVKVEKFEYINLVPNEIRTNYNIDVSNIALNQSDYMKQMKGGENEFDLLLNKNKEMEDFSQNTPISLLQEKYFIYAVSKWIKYSLPNPQSQLTVKYSYKSGHPMFDPINLVMTNFTLWIERIETRRNDNRKALISINSSVNYNNNNLRNKMNSKGKNLSNKKKGYAKMYFSQSNNSTIDKKEINLKRNNSKTKISK